MATETTAEHRAGPKKAAPKIKENSKNIFSRKKILSVSRKRSPLGRSEEEPLESTTCFRLLIDGSPREKNRLGSVRDVAKSRRRLEQEKKEMKSTFRVSRERQSKNERIFSQLLLQLIIFPSHLLSLNISYRRRRDVFAPS